MSAARTALASAVLIGGLGAIAFSTLGDPVQIRPPNDAKTDAVSEEIRETEVRREVVATAERPAQPVKLESWRGRFDFLRLEPPAVLSDSGLQLFDRLGPNATEVIRQHLERNYLGTLEWIESGRNPVSGAMAERTQAIELARDQAKLEYFQRGLYWLVESRPGETLPSTGMFGVDGHDITFVKGLRDDDGTFKYLITYVSHDHPMMDEALSL